MNVEALPYTLLIILVELAVGSLWVTLYTDLRGNGVTRGFVLTMALSVAVCAGLAYWTATTLNVTADIDGYPIDPGPFGAVKQALLWVTGLSTLYMFSVFMGWDPVGRLAGIAGSVAGLIAVGLLATMLEPPAWSYVGVFAALFAGTAAMGAVSTAMVWGHWYLTEGSLPAKPMHELAWMLIGVLGLQTVLLVVNSLIPENVTPTPANPIDGGLLANPMFYFRIGVGLVFAGILAVLSLHTARIKAMQSATGLLYIAMGAVFTGEVLARGIQFLTAKPV